MSWRDGLTNSEIAEELGYTHNCRGCGQKSDTPWCGCAAGEPGPDSEEAQAREILMHLNTEIDQLESESEELLDAGGTIQLLLAAAWWHTEDALRDEGNGSCGHRHSKEHPGCLCCKCFEDRRALAQRIGRAL